MAHGGRSFARWAQFDGRVGAEGYHGWGPESGLASSMTASLGSAGQQPAQQPWALQVPGEVRRLGFLPLLLHLAQHGAGGGLAGIGSSLGSLHGKISIHSGSHASAWEPTEGRFVCLEFYPHVFLRSRRKASNHAVPTRSVGTRTVYVNTNNMINAINNARTMMITSKGKPTE